jgi:hypothetical protein
MIQRKTAGITRTVYLVGDIAIKVANGRYTWQHWLKGLIANLKERERHTYNLPQLCPVLWSDPWGVVVVQRRAATLTDEQHARLFGAEAPEPGGGWYYMEFFDTPEFKEKFGNWIPTENKPDSFGYLDGRLVAVDYANA